MALDPNIALGVRQIELANPLAQYGQVAAIQNAQNQNALAQFQLGAARRQEESQNVLADVYKRSLNPETGAVDNQALLRNLAASNAAYLIPDVQTKLLATEKERGLIKKTGVETEEKEFKLKNDKLNFAWNAVGSASTPQDAIQKITEGVKNGIFDMKGASADIQQLQNMTPEQYQQYRVQKVMGILDAKDKLGFMLPKVARQDVGGQIVSIQDNPALPGYGQPIVGGAIAKTPTFAEQTGQGQLNLARQKFAWEQANPGFELKEAEDGSIVGVNKRTLQAFPVSIGGAAPVAAPMAQTGMPGARVQAIPGMTSVLDQQAPAAAPMARTPLRGKGTALTESQGNATAFGMRMKEANAILEPLEKAGKTNTGLIKGAVSGTVGLVPFIGDKLEDASGSIFNALPQVLGGLSPEQQQVAQARINFITALLRKESGAAIGASEFATAEKNYFPKPGDDAATIAQKQQARKTAIKAMEIQAGPGAKQMGGAGVISGATANNPLGLPGL
jgi:hypothetical protein